MHGKRVYQIRACFVVSEQFENAPGHKYGKYAVQGDPELSTYFAQEAPDATPLLLRLRFETSKPIRSADVIGNSLQSARVLTAEDDRLLREWAENNLLPLNFDADGSNWIPFEGKDSIDHPEHIAQDEGGGALSSVEERLAIEKHAMEIATRHYIAYEWIVEDVSSREPFDLRCIHPDGTEIHVEVKGTKTSGSKIRLTSGEVEHARKWGSLDMNLLIVANIKIAGAAESPKASGGTMRLYESWDVDSCKLRAVQFECAVPQNEDSEEFMIPDN